MSILSVQTPPPIQPNPIHLLISSARKHEEETKEENKKKIPRPALIMLISNFIYIYIIYVAAAATVSRLYNVHVRLSCLFLKFIHIFQNANSFFCLFCSPFVLQLRVHPSVCVCVCVC